MDIQQLRHDLKHKWLDYYQTNRHWLSRLGVWVNCDGQRRPSSGFILATLAVVEPQLNDLLPLVVDLNDNPDRIIIALGLNFNPDEALAALTQDAEFKEAELKEEVKFLPASAQRPLPESTSRRYSRADESCEGRGQRRRKE
jgi:Family of unknown function (DUF5331)